MTDLPDHNLQGRDLPDYELRTSTDAPPYEIRTAADGRSSEQQPHRSSAAWIAIVLVAAAVGIAAYFVIGPRSRRAGTEPPVTVTDSTPRPAPPRALGADAPAAALPPLAESDAYVRMLVKMLTSHPTAAAWLTTNGLIRNFTVAVSNIADGGTPAKQLAVLRPAGAFRVVERGGAQHVDLRSYQRYDALADALASADPAGYARLYSTLKPRIEEAYRELGRAPGSFDRALEQAIVLLLKTPAVDASVRPAVEGIGYEFDDPRLENLTAAQKQMLRMGPRNIKVVRGQLRAIGLALGIPASEMPAE